MIFRTSSENIEYDSESGSELRKRDKPDNVRLNLIYLSFY